MLRRYENAWPIDLFPTDTLKSLYPLDFISSELNQRGIDLDVSETPSGYVVEAEVPGFTKDQVTLSVTGSQLTIKGEKQSISESANYLRRERSKHSFRRTVTLPCAIDCKKVEAHLEGGVLKIDLPKGESQINVPIRIA
jgi:HSP20 family protein